MLHCEVGVGDGLMRRAMGGTGRGMKAWNIPGCAYIYIYVCMDLGRWLPVYIYYLLYVS